jgi:formylglycine-generating enzyme required for sulfatase activity
MGSPATEVSRNTDETQHTVTLSAFRMSKYEITNAQYAAFLNAKSIGSNGVYTAGAYPTQALIYASVSYDWGLHYTNNQWVPVAGYENNPVIYVTWYGATEFATYAGGALPTEAQWEYACRAGTTTPFHTGNCLTNLQANYYWANPYSTCTNTNTTCQFFTQPVGTYTANAYGMYDMQGNVWEWCSDWYGTYPTTAQTNPTGAATGWYRVSRGGSWADGAQYCRSAYRSSAGPSYDYWGLGFRVVLVP